jgi:hypothetical protein
MLVFGKVRELIAWKLPVVSGSSGSQGEYEDLKVQVYDDVATVTGGELTASGRQNR